MSVLITGGAGYIGAHTCKHLSNLGHDLVVLDNLSTGARRNARWGTFVEGDIADKTLVRALLRKHSVGVVVHLAASAHVGESIARPEFYFANNIVATKALLDAMLEERVQQLVFASSCSVYGNAVSDKVQEREAVAPVSPYGESKLAVERLLPWYERAHALRWIALRYFNAAGAEDDLGEDPAVSKRIFPRALHAALNQGQPLQVYGTQFSTRDGSAVRDYVHVSDVAQANVSALDWLAHGNSGAIVNIGAGEGTSVLDILRAVEHVTGKPVPHHIQPAREGDPARAIADPSLAHEILGWLPRHSQVETIVASLVRSWQLRGSGSI